MTILTKPTELILAAAPELLPVRVLAGIALVAVIVAFVHVLRHLKHIEQTILKDDLENLDQAPLARARHARSQTSEDIRRRCLISWPSLLPVTGAPVHR